MKLKNKITIFFIAAFYSIELLSSEEMSQSEQIAMMQKIFADEMHTRYNAHQMHSASHKTLKDLRHEFGQCKTRDIDEINKLSDKDTCRYPDIIKDALVATTIAIRSTDHNAKHREHDRQIYHAQQINPQAEEKFYVEFTDSLNPLHKLSLEEFFIDSGKSIYPAGSEIFHSNFNGIRHYNDGDEPKNSIQATLQRTTDPKTVELILVIDQAQLKEDNIFLGCKSITESDLAPAQYFINKLFVEKEKQKKDPLRRKYIQSDKTHAWHIDTIHENKHGLHTKITITMPYDEMVTIMHGLPLIMQQLTPPYFAEAKDLVQEENWFDFSWLWTTQEKTEEDILKEALKLGVFLERADKKRAE